MLERSNLQQMLAIRHYQIRYWEGVDKTKYYNNCWEGSDNDKLQQRVVGKELAENVLE